MSVIVINEMAAPYDETIVLSAATPVVRVFDCQNAPLEGVQGENTGSNPLTSVGVELSMVSNTNAEYQHQTAAESAIGTVAAGSQFSWANNGSPQRFVRITLTSTLGTTVQLQARAL